MMKPQQAPATEPTLAHIQRYIAEFEKASPLARRTGLVALFAFEIKRVRSYKEAQGT